MKQLLLIILFSTALSTAFAQSSSSKLIVKGLLEDSLDHKQLTGVTITLKDSATLKVVKTTLSKENGSFELTGLALQSYQLTLAAVGYHSKSIAVSATLWRSASIAELGTLILSAAMKELQTVSVTASKQIIKQEIDRLAYDVQADPDSKALTVMEMLRKVPMVTVDGDDNIQLQGSSSYRIFINGKHPNEMLLYHITYFILFVSH